MGRDDDSAMSDAADLPSLERLSRSEFQQANAVLTRSFIGYPLMQYTVHVESRRQRPTEALYGAVLSDSLKYGEVFGIDGIKGVACWLPPETEIPGLVRQIRAGFLTMPFHFGVMGTRRLVAYGNIADELHHRYAPEPHWYLAVIGVDPDHQRQGLASRLMEPKLAQADAKGQVCYLDTHLAGNVRLYQRHGFQVMWEGTAPGHSLTIWSMRREPNA